MLLLADRQMRVLAADGRFALTVAAPRTAGCTGSALDIGVTFARPLAWAARSTKTDGSFVFTPSVGPTGDTSTALDIGVTFARPARLAWAARATRTDGSFVSIRTAGWNAKAALDIGLTSAARCFMVSVGLRRAWAGLARHACN